MKKFALKLNSKNVTNMLYPLLGIGLFVLIWFIVSTIVGVEMILPTPIQSLTKLFSLIGAKEFWLAVASTIGRALYGFAVSFALALLLAILSYIVKPIEKVLNPIIVVLRAVPTMSIILLALIWMKSATAPILIAFLILFPQLYASFLSALNGINRELIDMSKVFKVPVYKRIIGLYIPEALPSTLDAMRANVSLSVKVTIAGEVLAQTYNSMGVSMQISKMYLDTGELLAWTIMAIVLSYLLEGVFALIKYFVTRGKYEN